MGYEIRFYVASKSNIEMDNRTWAEEIAMFEYCKDYQMLDFIHSVGHPTNCYLYDTDGNTKILEDDYHEPLYELTIDDMVSYMESHKNFEYRRYEPWLALLKVFQRDNKVKWKDLVVLSYGH